MTSYSTRTGINTRRIITAIEEAGMTVPKAIITAAADEKKIGETVRGLNADSESIVRRWVNATLEGTDPTSDPEMGRLILTSVLTSREGFEGMARAAAAERTRTALTAQQNKILAAFKTTVDNAGKTLREAFEVIGDRRLTDHDSIFRMGGHAVDLHTAANRAEKTIRIIDQGWVALSELTDFAPTTNAYIERFADLPLDVWERLRRTNPTPWDIIRTGATIDYATNRQTIKERQQRHATDKNTRSRDRAEKQSERLRTIKDPIPLLATLRARTY